MGGGYPRYDKLSLMGHDRQLSVDIIAIGGSTVEAY